MKVCVFGNIGSGKSKIINQLKGTTNWEVLAIDNFRRQYGLGTEKTELIAREHFINSINPTKNQLIECTGIGQVANQLYNQLIMLNEKVICLVLITKIEVCKSRIKNRIWDIPFPHPIENVPKLMERIDEEIGLGEVLLKWNAMKNSALIERNNDTEIENNNIVMEILAIIDSPTEIDLMLSEEVQGYYGNEYLYYQSQVINKNDTFLGDKEMIFNFIKNQKIIGSILDVGAGSCQWYSFFNEKISDYYAIDSNKKALEQAPKNAKLTTINQNVFDENFNLTEVIKKPINNLLFSFFLSHFSDDQIAELCNKLGVIDYILIIDSFWGDKHKQKYATKEISTIPRKTSHNTIINLPKRFFDKGDLDTLGNKLGYKVSNIQLGNYWFVCLMEKLK